MAKLTKLGARIYQPGSLLVPHLEAWFARGEFPDEIPFAVKMNKERDDAFHPSSALKCAREIYAERLDLVPHEKPSLEMQKAFMFGHYAHGLIQWVLLNGLKFSREEDIEREFDWRAETEAGNPLRIRGYLDAASCEIPAKGNYPIDIKTVQSRQFAAGLSEGMLAKYTAQLNIYLFFVDKVSGILLLWEKDSPHRFKELLIERDDDLIEDIFQRWEMTADSIARQEPPPCTCVGRIQCESLGDLLT